MHRIWTEFFGGFNERDFGRMASLYAEDALVHSKEGPLRGPKALEQISAKWLVRDPGLQLEPLHLSEEGDLVTIHWAAREGGRTLCHGHTCFLVADGQVVEHWACVDSRALEREPVGP